MSHRVDRNWPQEHHRKWTVAVERAGIFLMAMQSTPYADRAKFYERRARYWHGEYSKNFQKWRDRRVSLGLPLE